jgi:aryl carrier-like protein
MILKCEGNDLKSDVRDVVCGVILSEDFGDDDNLFECGLTSLKAGTLATLLRY